MVNTRVEILMCLINTAEEMTLSAISKEMDVPHQLVRYHLPFLLDAGLIIKTDGRYFCQPAFIDANVQQEILEGLSESITLFLDRIFLDFDNIEDKRKALANCLQIQMLLTVANMEKLFAVT